LSLALGLIYFGESVLLLVHLCREGKMDFSLPMGALVERMGRWAEPL